MVRGSRHLVLLAMVRISYRDDDGVAILQIETMAVGAILHQLLGGFGRVARSLARLFRDNQLDMLHTNNTGCKESPVAARWAGSGESSAPFMSIRLTIFTGSGAG